MGASTGSGIQRRDARLRAAGGRGRLIIDDDGDLVFTEAARRGLKSFLEQRLDPLAGTGVKSVAWCIMWGIAVGKGQTTYWETQQTGRPLSSAMPDPTPVMVEAARRAGMEIFGSIRMNDTHDAFGKPHGRLVYPLKVEHPEWLLGDESQRGDFLKTPEALTWSGLDYAVPQVREDRLWWVRHTAESYDLDGVDLNFFRMPWFFKPGAAEQGMPLMTDLVRQARGVLDEVSERRGRPMLLGVRVPGAIEDCRRVGIDVETWLREGLVDRLLFGGGYSPFTSPAEELVRLAHAHDVPAYPCINCGAPSLGGDEALRGAASNIHWSGADGIYLWNYQYRDVPKLGYGRPTAEGYDLLSEIESAPALMYLDKAFGVESVSTIAPYAIASHGAQLPLALGRQALESVRTVRLRVGDDVAAAHRAGRLDRALLALELEGSERGDVIAVQVNGRRLRPVNCPPVRDGASPKLDRRRYEIPGAAMLQGDNAVAVWIEGRRGRTGAPILLDRAWLHVSYKSDAEAVRTGRAE